MHEHNFVYMSWATVLRKISDRNYAVNGIFLDNILRRDGGYICLLAKS